MTFLECVNRILRTCAILRGDTDEVSTFSDTQHNASLNLAIVATQNELTRLIADRLIPYERLTSGTITAVSGTRTYSLATGFTRFYGHAHLSIGTIQLYEWPGGLEDLQIRFPNWDTETGTPYWWYFEPTTTKKIGLFQVPNTSGDVYTYEYEGSVLVSSSTDTMPFHNTEENYMFVEMAARRFKFMFEDIKNELDIQAVLDKDTTYRSSKAMLSALIKGKNPSRSYANTYS